MQVEYLLGTAATFSSGNLTVLGVAPAPVCGNGVCEIGERPIANTTTALGSAGGPPLTF